jgi:nanoRNase/pAp phosphatase (c-di-AMP/oligoRNAs hydrolase)
MFEILTRDEDTQDLLDELRDYRVPVEWYMYRAAAIQNMEAKGAVRIAPVGYVRQEYRDVIAEIASDLLRIEGTPARRRSATHRARHRASARLRLSRSLGIQV